MPITPEQLTRWKAQRSAASGRYRRGHRPQVNAYRREAHRIRTAAAEWIFIDGEGWGTDELGRQCYRLMTAATDGGFEDSLVADGERTTTVTIPEKAGRPAN